MESKVYWAELQSTLISAGLNVVVDIPRPDYPWFGKIDGKFFTMTIPPKSNKDGFRHFMIVSLYGQKEEKVIPLLSKFMGYEPFCKYLHKKDTKASATYEWDRKNPAARLKKLKDNVDIYKLQRIEEGFQSSKVQDMEKFFHQLTPEIVEKFEKAVQKNIDAEWNYNRIRHILPFIRKVMPRIGKNQSIFGLSIISLDGKALNEREVVQYGLEPLLTACILTKEETELIISWYLQTQPTWDSGGAGYFQKEFEIDGEKYRLITDSCRNCRDLNLQ